MTLSLCMIVKNEEHTLGRCLDCAQGIADEIIIVDTGSIDATKSIAERFGCKVYDFEWVDDFSAARNYSFSLATCDYIMWLDADDVIPEASRNKLLGLKESLTDSVDVVMMPYNVAFDEQNKPCMTFYRERILRRQSGFVWHDPVHEVITPAGKIIYFDACVDHKKTRIATPGRNLAIYQALKARGAKFSTRQQFYYARELYYNDKYLEAIAEFKGFLRRKDGWIENKVEAYKNLADCLRRLGKHEDALKALFESFAIDLPRAETVCEIAAHYIEVGDFYRAAYWYETALKCPRNAQGGGFMLPDCYDFLPYIQLCLCHSRLGDNATAKKYNSLAAKVKPSHPSVLFNNRHFEVLEQEGKL